MKSPLLLLMFAMVRAAYAVALPATDFPIVNARPGLAPYGRENVEIAASRDQYLAVWEDNRSFPAPPRIFGTRIGASGRIIDTLGFPIAPLGPADPKTRIQAISSDGNDFLIAFTTRADLHFVKVTYEGVVGEVQTPGVTAGQVAMAPALFGYAVFVSDATFNDELPSTVRVFTIDRGGRFATTPTLAVSSPAIVSIAARGSANGNEAVLGWIDTADQAVHLHAYPTSPLFSGLPASIQQVAPQNSTSQLSGLGLATNGNEFFATWVEAQGGVSSYRARRFTSDGVPSGAPITLGPAVAPNPPRPVVVWDGSQYVVTMRTRPGSGLEAGFFNANGSPANSRVLLAEGNILDASVESVGAGSFFVWNQVRPNVVSQIFGEAVGRDGSLLYGVGQSALLSRSSPDVSDVSVVWQVDHYLAPWLETSDTTRAVVGRFTPNGELLDGNGIVVSSGSQSSAPSLATDGTTAIVSWADASGVTIASVDGAGHVVRVAAPFAAPLDRPVVHWNGSQFAIFWRSAQGVSGMRLARDGHTLDSQPPTVLPIGDAPAAAGWTGTEYVLLTRSAACGSPTITGCGTVYASFVSSSLNAIGPRVALTNTPYEPAIADGPSGSLIVFNVFTTVLGDMPVVRALIATRGSLLPVNSFERQPLGLPSAPTAFATGSDWVVVSGSYTWTVSSEGTTGPLTTSFPYVTRGSRAAVILGGPARLVVYRRGPVGNEQVAPVLGHYLFEPRHRPARH